MFEGLKEKLLDRTQRKSVKSELRGEVVYLKKGSIFAPIPFLGKKMEEWGQVYLPVNEDGTWNRPNLIFGGKRNIVKLIIGGVLVGIILLGYAELFNYINFLEDVCKPLLIP